MSGSRTVAEGWVPTTHGRPSVYNRGCRCEDCRRSHAARMRSSDASGRNRRANYARRVLVDGRWFAPGREGRHGEIDTYNRYGCRCGRCTAGSREYDEQRRARLLATEAAR